MVGLETETKTNKEFHKNGTLAYIETISRISKEKETSIMGGTYHSDGYLWIRVGSNRKYHDNGVVAWELIYDDNGNVMKGEGLPPKRYDGTNITY